MTPVWLAAHSNPVETTEGVSVLPTHAFADHPPINILFMPGGSADRVVAAMFDPISACATDSAKARTTS
jgi:transcriptional regulator GlxA family with amidase domain